MSTSLESMQRSAAFLRRAVELDPAFALAWLQLATALSFSLTFGVEGVRKCAVNGTGRWNA